MIALPTASEVALIEGMKFDDGKLRYDLIEDRAEREFVAALTYGAIKYDDGNWQKVPRYKYEGAYRRHMAEFRMGQRFDAESGLHHVGMAAASLHFILGLDIMQHGESDFDVRYAYALDVARKARAKRLGIAHGSAEAVGRVG